MMNVRVLNSKEKKEILEIIENQFGFIFDTDRVFFKNHEDLFLVNREAFDRVQPSWRVNSMGVYFGEVKNNQIRLSIEGSQFVGEHAKKGILDIPSSIVGDFLAGATLPFEHEDTGYVIVRYGKDFIGCAKVKENKLLNFVPKARRIGSYFADPE